MTERRATLIIVPVLRRPHRAQIVADSIAAATPEPHRVLFVANKGDTPEIAACEATGHDVLVMPYPHHPSAWRRRPGEWAAKINAAYRQSTEPFLFLGADDLSFWPGWLGAVLRVADDTGCGVIGTQDLGNPRVVAGNHSTHPVVARWYADEFGTAERPGEVLCEAYPHEFVDDELVATAKVRESWAFADDAVVEHLHYAWDKAPRDELYAEMRSRMAHGRRLFQRRRHLWSDPANLWENQRRETRLREVGR